MTEQVAAGADARAGKETCVNYGARQSGTGVRTCSMCPTLIVARNRSGLCKVHRDRARGAIRHAKRARVPCVDCARPTLAGRCASCASKAAMAAPGVVEKIRAASIARWAKPGARERQSRSMTERMAALDEGQRQRLREAGRKGYDAGLALPEVMAKTCSPEVRARAGAAISATKLAHIPPTYRAAYRELIDGGTRKVDACALIADQVAADQRRAAAAEVARLAALTPHERNLERIRNGARLVKKVAIPSRDLAYTAGGVSAGLL